MLSCLASAWAQTYGVAGSRVVPITTMGGLPAPETGCGVDAGGIGQVAHPNPDSAMPGPKRG